MNTDQIRELASNRTALKRLAKFMAQQCFRNSYIEKIHAGKIPESKTGDYSDVLVKTPMRDIPWIELSRISQEEMKRLNKEVTDKCFAFLKLVLTEPATLLEALEQTDLVPDWDDPKPAKVTRRKP
jgi:hypothetical protein